MPPVILLDSIETCLSLEPLRAELEKLGLRPDDLELWFARALRDAFAREAAGTFVPFKDVLETALVILLRARGKPGQASGDVIERFAELPAHPDVRPGLELARRAGARVAVVTNGGEKPTRKAFERAGVDDLVELFLSVDEIQHYKPAREVYVRAARDLDVRPEDCVLVAAHAWDVRGARRAGLGAAFLERAEPISEELAREVDAMGHSLDGLLHDVLQLRATRARSA